MSTPPTEHQPSAPNSRSDTETCRASQARVPGRRKKLILSITLAAVVLVAVPLGARAVLLFQGQQRLHVASPKIPDPTYVVSKNLDPERRIARQIDHLLSHMSLQEELGQLIVVAFNGTRLTPDLQSMIAKQQIGGTILYAENVQSLPQIQTLDTALQAQAKIPLLISTDQEGGITLRLSSIIGWTPSAQDIGATNDPKNAYKQGVKDGQALKQIGANVNLAPVVDVQTVSDRATIVPTRMFGTTPAKVITFAGAYLDGLQGQGIIGCLKHWPGLGAATVDPHHGLPVITRSQKGLNAIDFAPYRTLIKQGRVDLIMATHELVPAYDPTMPASVSPILIDQVLRHDLGYQGVVITDTLTMGGLSYRWSLAQAAVLAILAGDDLLLGPRSSYQVQRVVDALQAAVTSGQISKARIDLSVERILALKLKAGLISVPPS